MRQRLGKDFERYQSLQVLILRQPNDTHSATAENFL